MVALTISASTQQTLPDGIARTIPPSLDATEPVQCWLRTTASAVRVGEVFSVVLTCALLNTNATIVVADTTKLDSTSLQLPPFDVIGATHVADVQSGDRRFLQYEYRARVISDALFGAEVALPEIKIPYRVRTRLESGELSEGLERAYGVKPLSVRVLSLVPDAAADIRDASTVTFAALESRALTANILTNGGGVLMALGALFTIVALVQGMAGTRTRAASGFRPLSDHAILRNVSRELDAVGRERDASGWTPELARRALAAMRIPANYVIGRPPNQREVDPDIEEQAGALLDRRHAEKTVLISGSATPQDLSGLLGRPTGKKRRTPDDRQRLADLQQSLAYLTRVCYSRDADAPVDRTTADASLTLGSQLVRQLQRDHHWIVRTARSMTARARRARRRLWVR